jgi:hypothetical protein
VKTFLLLLAIAVSAVHAQDEVALSSAFGAGEGVNGEVFAVGDSIRWEDHYWRPL